MGLYRFDHGLKEMKKWTIAGVTATTTVVIVTTIIWWVAAMPHPAERAISISTTNVKNDEGHGHVHSHDPHEHSHTKNDPYRETIPVRIQFISEMTYRNLVKDMWDEWSIFNSGATQPGNLNGFIQDSSTFLNSYVKPDWIGALFLELEPGALDVASIIHSNCVCRIAGSVAALRACS